MKKEGHDPQRHDNQNVDRTYQLAQPHVVVDSNEDCNENKDRENDADDDAGPRATAEKKRIFRSREREKESTTTKEPISSSQATLHYLSPALSPIT